MKKVLGLDLGVGSIGWALVNVDETHAPVNLLGMGSRIVPLTTDDAKEFTQGNAASKNQKRTQKRTARKGYDRYQLRRQQLTDKLRSLGMLPDERLIKLPVLELWELRANAATPSYKLSLPEIGRVLYHINQKRGYRHSRDEDSDKQQRDYVAAVNNRWKEIREEGKTIGQHFANKLKETEIISEKGKFYTYRIKEQVFPRGAYMEEFDRIVEAQKVFWPDIFTDENVDELRNRIIFFQRPLKSCKHLVSLCDFEVRDFVKKDHSGNVITDRNGNQCHILAGPKVAPKSSPLSQESKLWEEINNIRITNSKNDEFFISQEKKVEIYRFLSENEVMKANDLKKILGISANDKEWTIDKAVSKGLTGNTTRTRLRKALSHFKREDLLRFDMQLTDSSFVNPETGEILHEIDPKCEQEPLYRLWHCIYSIDNKEDLAKALENQFGITNKEAIDNLNKIDFVKQGYGSKSAKFIRRILPYLQNGAMYSEACEIIGTNHSGSLTKAENAARQLLQRIPQLNKNELRQPVVEKILNQMINVVNAIAEKFGSIDEIRIEMARELKLSQEARATTAKSIRDREKINLEYAGKIREFGIVPSKNKILKYRLWEEAGQRCFYCGQTISAQEFLSGFDSDIEHIIPKSRLFDDSYSNKACSCRKCNSTKNNMTAYDFMKAQGEDKFKEYCDRVANAYKEGKISRTKRDRFMTPAEKIPKDFISRQLVQTQYISRKAMEILMQICHDVYASSGDVTAYLRRIWGYDEILQRLNIPRYREGGLTEMVTYEHNNQQHTEERIKGWSKRLDHRHHAIDALTIACTRQNIIQRLNNLNAQESSGEDKLNLDKWTMAQAHFSVREVSDAASRILISFKSGKKVATPGKRYIYRNGKRILAQENIIVPRGALSEESVYGKIRTIEKGIAINKLFDRHEDIFQPLIKKIIEERISEFDGNIKAAKASLKKRPLYLDKEKTIELKYGSCFKYEYVIKYPLNTLRAKDVEYIVDENIRETVSDRLSQFNGNVKEAFKEPLYTDGTSPVLIKTVRMFTGLDAVVPVRKDSDGKNIGFVKTGNNHHVAIYKDKEGKYQKHTVTFWHAVERKKYGIPIIIEHPDEVWQKVLDLDAPQSFIDQLPSPDWTYVMSMQQNEMFILGMGDDEFNDAMSAKDYRTLAQHLYRVQKVCSKDYYFRYQYETQLDDKEAALSMKKFYRVTSLSSLQSLNPKKVSINLLGDISLHNII